MEEIAKIAREGLLLPVKVEGDRSSFDCNFKKECSIRIDQAISNLKRLLPNCPFPSKEELTKNNQEFFQVLILCGENNVCADWNTQELVNNVNGLLGILLSKFGLQNVQDVFALECVSHSVLQQLKPKLAKNEIKAYPAAVNCFVWVVTNTMLPSIDDVVHFAVPVSLVLFDDWESEYQEKGLECISHILTQNPRSLLQRGWPAVVLSSLRKNMEFCDKIKLFKCLDNCLKAQNLNPIDPASWNQNDQYDLIVDDLLQSMVVQDSSDKAKTNLEILIILFQSVQIRMVKFLPLIISVMDSYVSIGTSPDIRHLVSEVLEQILLYCWDCLAQFTTHLSLIIFKLDEHKPMDEKTSRKTALCKNLLQSKFLSDNRFDV